MPLWENEKRDILNGTLKIYAAPHRTEMAPYWCGTETGFGATRYQWISLGLVWFAVYINSCIVDADVRLYSFWKCYYLLIKKERYSRKLGMLRLSCYVSSYAVQLYDNMIITDVLLLCLEICYDWTCWNYTFFMENKSVSYRYITLT